MTISHLHPKCTVISTIACVHQFIVMIVIIQNNIKSKELSYGHKLRLPLLITTLLSIFFYFIFQISFIMIAYFDIIFTSSLSSTCDSLWIICETLYWISKYLLWLYSIIRLIIAFYTSPTMQYTKKTLVMINILLFLVVVIILSVIQLYTFTDITQTNQGTINCFAYFPWWVSPFSGILDGAVSMSLLWLFYRKLRVLLDKNSNADLSYLVRKYLILLMAEIFSTYSLMIGVFTPLFITFFSIDTMINVWCLILYDIRYNDIYLAIFGKCAGVKVNDQKGADVTAVDSSTVSANVSSGNISSVNSKHEIDLADYVQTTEMSGN